MKDALIIGLAAAAVYAVWRISQPATPALPTGTPASATQSFLSSIGLAAENTVQQRTGIPLAAIGQAAQAAPTWVKVAFLPVGATAVAQGVITHPVDTAKKIGGAASSVVHSIGSIFG
jgi:hypothetical protein